MKILVIRFSSIGDIVLTFPVIRCLKQQLPESEIHYLTKSSFSELITASSYIDKTFFLEKSINQLIPLLKQEKYDAIIDLHNNLRTRIVSYKLGVSRVYRFPKLNVLKWLYVTLKINHLPSNHVVDRYFDAVKSLGVINDLKNNTFHLSKEVDVEEAFRIKKGNFIAIAIGAQFKTKRIPTEKLIEIISKVELPVVLLGGKMDEEEGNKLLVAVKNKTITNACGKYSLMESASILSQSKVLLTNDTGLMHIATCFNIPIVAVWGNTTPSLGMYAYRPENNGRIVNHEVLNLKCRPCSKIGFQGCPKRHFNCMMLQDSDKISADLR